MGFPQPAIEGIFRLYGVEAVCCVTCLALDQVLNAWFSKQDPRVRAQDISAELVRWRLTYSVIRPFDHLTTPCNLWANLSNLSPQTFQFAK